MASLSQLVLDLTNSLEQRKDLNEEQLVSLVESLIRSELKPGGPYLKDGKEDPLLNALILKLFVLLEKPLPNVERYLDKPIQISSDLTRIQFDKTIKEISALKDNQLTISSQKNTFGYGFFVAFTKNLNPEVQQYAEIIGKKIEQNDKNGEITKISSIFQDSINQPKRFSNNELELLGQANFIVWVAYSIYDAIIDNDMGIAALSTANILTRKSVEIYRKTSIDFNIAIDYLNKVDNANPWELAHCRFDQTLENINSIPIPTQNEMENLLANRAIAHIIGPLSIAARYKIDTKQFKKIERALKYYCIARQLNDDLHDWVEDFNNGRITFVLARLLQSAEFQPGSHNRDEVLTSLKTIFYERELESLCELTVSYVNKSRSLLLKAGLLDKNNLFINSFLNPIAYSASRALNIHKSNKTSLQKLNI